MNAQLSRLISSATVPIEEMTARLMKSAALVSTALVCFIVGAALLTAALFVYVQRLLGTAMTALAIGILYLGVAGILIIFVALRRSRKPQTVADLARVGHTADYPPPERLAFARSIDEAAAPILGVLRQEGLERERLALAAGAEIAKQLHPFSLLAFATVAGLVLGRIIKQRAELLGRARQDAS